MTYILYVDPAVTYDDACTLWAGGMVNGLADKVMRVAGGGAGIGRVAALRFGAEGTNSSRELVGAADEEGAGALFLLSPEARWTNTRPSRSAVMTGAMSPLARGSR